MDQGIDRTLRQLSDAVEGRPRSKRQFKFDLAHSAIYGGVSGGLLATDEFTFADGLSIRRTFAHVMSPYLMAFAKPDAPSKPHPGPWRPVSGGNGFDVNIEIVLAERALPAKFDRLNTIWWLLSLLRLMTGMPLILPVLTDTAFAEAKYCEHDPQFWSVEMSRPRSGEAVANYVIDTNHLEAVKELFLPGAALMEIEHFNRAYRTMDSAPLAHSSGAAIVMIWAAIETLFRPGQNQLTKRLSKAIATHLELPGRKREALQQHAARLYEQRGSSIHNSQEATATALAETAKLARLAFIKCMKEEAVPDCDALLISWSAEHPKNFG